MDSQAIVNTMEVLDTKPLTDLVTEATIKICYVSDKPNLNGTVISREVGKEMASTLPGSPVVGFFNKESGDFEEHNRKITFSDGDIVIDELTRPYGFVSPIEAPWYQDFEEDGEIRTYLMCKAYLWTRQYEEAALALDKGQSMELDEKSMRGYYSGNVFVFTAVTLEKLCILGDNFVPCFEGAKIISNYSKQFTDLSAELEPTIGRRYYVMNNQLVTKPSNVTLDYALQLGWNITDAICVQLANRGAQNKYDVQGIYSENGEIFTILLDRETLEYVRCTVLITDQDTVQLASEMVAVRQTWAVKTPSEPVPAEPMNGTPVMAPSDAMTTVYTEGGATAPAKESAPALDFSKVISEFSAKLASVEAKLTEKDNQIGALSATVTNYKVAEAAAIAEKKKDLISSYKSLLNEDEISGIMGNIAKYSLDELESKLAVTYTRKQKVNSNGGMQVNIGSVTPEANVPDFIRQAQEYDKNREFRLV